MVIKREGGGGQLNVKWVILDLSRCRYSVLDYLISVTRPFSLRESALPMLVFMF